MSLPGVARPDPAEPVDPAVALAQVIRTEGGQLLATLIRFAGDIDLAEEALQEACIAAAEVWRRDGVPNRPGAWLSTVARNKALDRLRREHLRASKERAATVLLTGVHAEDFGAVDRNSLNLVNVNVNVNTNTTTNTNTSPGGGPSDGNGVQAEPADLLRLIFTCCHPALSTEAQITLALRLLCGLSTIEIARVFLVPDGTIGQRITRAKAKIARARIPYRVPSDEELPDRLRPVLATLSAMFTVGHHATAGTLDERVDLAAEAIRLARVLWNAMPDEGEVAGLLALMLAQHARRATRLDDDGEAVLLAEQDRARWDTAMVAEAHDLVESVLRRGRPGRFVIQAAIACLHDHAATWEATDWRQIAELYRLLEVREPTAVVRVNRAVAEAQVAGPAVGLAVLATLDESAVTRWHLYWATRADFHRRLGSLDAAAADYRRALDCPANDTDRRFLLRRLAEVTTTASSTRSRR